METSDHDLLIKLNTLIESMAEQQRKFIDRYEVRHADLSNRVSVLENQDSRDSERFKGITEEIRRSLNNSSKIEQLQTDVNGLGIKLTNTNQTLDELRNKANIFDIVNAIGVMISGVVGYFFGNK